MAELPRPQVNIAKNPLPTGLDPSAVEEVRAWIRAVLDNEVASTAVVDPRILVLCSDKLVTAPLAGLFDVGQEIFAAAYWAALGAIDGNLRRFRVGVVTVEGRTAAVAMEFHWGDDLEPVWWYAWRFFGEGALSTGVLHGDWREEHGTGLDALPESFREWLDAGKAHVDLPPLDWQPRPGLDMQTEMILRRGPPPTSAEQLVDELRTLVDPEVSRKGVDSLWVFASHGEWLEWWRIKGEIPCSLDDALRNVAIFAGADGIAVLFLAPARMPDGGVTKAAVTLGELGGRRFRRVVPLLVRPDGSVEIPVQMREDLGEVPAEARWIGVAPGHDLEIRTESIVKRGLVDVPES